MGKVKEFVLDHEEEIKVAGSSILVIAGAVVLALKNNPNIIENVHKIKGVKVAQSLGGAAKAVDEHKRWVDRLADINEAIHDTRGSINKLKFKRADLISDLKLAEEGVCHYKKTDAPGIQKAIERTTNQLKKHEKELDELLKTRDIHYHLEP